MRLVTCRRNVMTSRLMAFWPVPIRPPTEPLKFVLVSGFKLGLPKQQVGSIANNSYASGYRKAVPTLPRAKTRSLKSYRPLAFQTDRFPALDAALNRAPKARV